MKLYFNSTQGLLVVQESDIMGMLFTNMPVKHNIQLFTRFGLFAVQPNEYTKVLREVAEEFIDLDSLIDDFENSEKFINHIKPKFNKNKDKDNEIVE